MKFNKIKISTDITKSKGVSEINIQRLSNVVALVGKNGSGKSRILDLIEENIFKSITILQVADGSISHLPKHIEKFANQLVPFKDYYLIHEKIKELSIQASKEPSNSKIKNELQVLKQNLRSNQIFLANQNQLNGFYQQFPQLIEPLKRKCNRRKRTIDNCYTFH